MDLLPIVDNQSDILITRTYRHIAPDKTLVDLINAAENPLELLYTHFHELLPPVFRMRLLNAAVQESGRIPASSAVHQTLTSLLENVSNLAGKYENLINLVANCEQVVAGLVGMVLAGAHFESMYPFLLKLHG